MYDDQQNSLAKTSHHGLSAVYANFQTIHNAIHHAILFEHRFTQLAEDRVAATPQVEILSELAKAKAAFDSC